MKTEKLYEQDPFLQSFTGTVLSCESEKNRYFITLDRTAFYPEGGGQPTDTGILGNVQVLDVQDRDGVVIHVCDGPLEKNQKVSGKINWERRFDHMQQHSGEHILSGILCREYACDNVGFHLGASVVTIDYNTDITWEQVLYAERQANQVIWADLPVEITYPDGSELAELDYRSKKALTGQVRIVKFPDADCCACCGTHVLRAGQVGLIKILSCQKFREGVRLEIICGKRAYLYLNQIYEQDRAIGQRLSVKPQETLLAVERLEQELSEAKSRAVILEERLFEQISQENAGQGDTILFQPVMSADSVRRLADAVAHTCGRLAAVFSEAENNREQNQEPDQWLYALVRADGAEVMPLIKQMNQVLHGRGGGRNGFAQGRVHARQKEIQEFFQRILQEQTSS